MDRDTFEKTLRALCAELGLVGEGLEPYIQKNINYVMAHSRGDWDETVALERIRYLEGD